MNRHSLTADYDQGRRDFGDLTLPQIQLPQIAWENVNFSGSDLSSGNFFQAQLPHGSFANCNLCHCNFEGAIVRHGDFCNADLVEANLSAVDFSFSLVMAADLQRAIAMQGQWIGVDFRGSFLAETMWVGSNLQGAVFQGSSLNQANLSYCNLQDCDFRECDLEGAIFHRAIITPQTRFSHKFHPPQAFLLAPRGHLVGENLQGLKLRPMDLSGICLDRTDLAHGDFSGVIFNHGQLRHTNFTGANLTGAQFLHCDLTGANFTGANLTGAQFDPSHRPESENLAP